MQNSYQAKGYALRVTFLAFDFSFIIFYTIFNKEVLEPPPVLVGGLRLLYFFFITKTISLCLIIKAVHLIYPPA